MPVVVSCPKCRGQIELDPSDADQKMQCPLCSAIFVVKKKPTHLHTGAVTGSATAIKTAPPRPNVEPLDDLPDIEDDLPPKKRRDDDQDNGRPHKKRRVDDGEDDRPRKKRRDDDDDKVNDDDENDCPRKKRRDEEDADDRPRRKRRDEDDARGRRSRKKKQPQSSAMLFILLGAGGLCVLGLIVGGVCWFAFSGSSSGAGEGQGGVSELGAEERRGQS